MIRRHKQCPGLINALKCPFKCSDNNKSCRIHINGLDAWSRAPLNYKITEPPKNLNSTCSLCNKVMFYIPKTYSQCKYHGFCRECTDNELIVMNDCIICMSMEEID